MISTYSAIKIYCERNNRKMSRRHEVFLIGGVISTYFKGVWGINQPEEIISQAGFLVSDEPGLDMLVVGYPDCFLEEMLARIQIFFEEKQKEKELRQKMIMEAEKVVGRERKRIPFKPSPVKKYSAKPENPIL